MLELVVCGWCFRAATGAAHRAAHPTNNDKTGTSRTREALKNPITWICALFLLFYVGVEVSLGGWLVTFMLRVRHGKAFESGLVVTGFWLGLTCGRVILGFVTGKIGEKIAIAVYMVCISFPSGYPTFDLNIVVFANGPCLEIHRCVSVKEANQLTHNRSSALP